jgi:hypothetical protein
MVTYINIILSILMGVAGWDCKREIEIGNADRDIARLSERANSGEEMRGGEHELPPLSNLPLSLHGSSVWGGERKSALSSDFHGAKGLRRDAREEKFVYTRVISGERLRQRLANRQPIYGGCANIKFPFFLAHAFSDPKLQLVQLTRLGRHPPSILPFSPA